MSRTTQVLFALIFGGVVSVAADRVFFRPPASTVTEAAPAAAPVDPSEARTWATAALSELSVGGVEYGVYPLRGPQRAPSETIPLLSFNCPSPCVEFYETLRIRAERKGYYFAEPRQGDRAGGPSLRALSRGPRPALAFRAFPATPRLTLVISGVKAEELEGFLALDRHVTAGLHAGAASTPASAARLGEMGREFILQIPMNTPAMSAPEGVAEGTRAALAALPEAAGVAQLDGAAFLASRRHTAPFLEVLRDEGRFFLNQRLSPADIASATALTMGVRRAEVTHALEPGDLETQLRGVEAALVLEGRALVMAPSTPEILAALGPWLTHLKAKKINLLRLSEIVL